MRASKKSFLLSPSPTVVSFNEHDIFLFLELYHACLIGGRPITVGGADCDGEPQESSDNF